MFYSEQRAKEVKQALVKLGFPEKISTKAMGSSNPIPGIPGESAQNRRVTFQFLVSEPEAKDSSTDSSAPKLIRICLNNSFHSKIPSIRK